MSLSRPTCLTRAKRLVDPALVAQLQTLHPDLRRAAEYHLGYVEADGTPGRRRRKGRPPGARAAVGRGRRRPSGGRRPGRRGRRADARLLAPPRRHHRRRPTAPAPPDGVGAVRGRPGDPRRRRPADAGPPGAARPTNGSRALPPATAWPTAVAEMIAGQADDMALESEEHVGVDECERMAAAKTGALLSCAAALGAELAGGDARAVDAARRLRRPRRTLVPGRRRRARDLGRPCRHGQARGLGPDRRRRRRCRWRSRWPRRATRRRELQAMFRNGNLDEAAVRRATDLVERAGAREATEEFARAHLRAAAGGTRRRRPRSRDHRAAARWSPSTSASASCDRRAARPDNGGRGRVRPRPSRPCSECSTPTDGGRASCRPTSRSTPRTSCCASSSASAPTPLTEATANWIRAQQRDDGTWATFTGGPADLSTTVEAYAALRLAGDPPDAAHMEKAAAFVRDAGGLERARVFTHMWLALGGQWSWDEIPALPPEVILLPSWFPLNIYDFACWARQTIVALTVVAAHRPVPAAAVRPRRAAHRVRSRPPGARCARSRGSSSCSTVCSTATSGTRCAGCAGRRSIAR